MRLNAEPKFWTQTRTSRRRTNEGFYQDFYQQDFYQSSDEIKKYAMLTMGVLGVGSAYGLTRIL
jgi:hypothetical protein